MNLLQELQAFSHFSNVEHFDKTARINIAQHRD